MEQTPFRPVDVLRRLEAAYATQAEAGHGTFEAFGSLGCENGRLGEPEAMMSVVQTILGLAPFAEPDRNVRLKLSAKPMKPIVIEVLTGAETPEIDPSVEALVGRLGGAVATQRSALGRTVRVTLPWSEIALEDASAESPVPEESASLEGMRILIADDSATNRLVLEEMLADTHAALTSVQDGKEAVDCFHAAPFDLLLLDISMPVMDGVTAIREIRAAESARGMPPTAAIAVTANALVNQVADYLVAGFDTHLAKPFRRKDLMHAILTLRK
ncbi:response regulator [Gemmobacter sp.]|uniref:response regulator n=1 Tax=Gemmobacter sp. TaxID=1898957 RepID=UPI002AFDDC8D|nr:response regulator [Gemmobacter sp.]